MNSLPFKITLRKIRAELNEATGNDKPDLLNGVMSILSGKARKYLRSAGGGELTVDGNRLADALDEARKEIRRAFSKTGLDAQELEGFRGYSQETQKAIDSTLRSIADRISLEEKLKQQKEALERLLNQLIDVTGQLSGVKATVDSGIYSMSDLGNLSNLYQQDADIRKNTVELNRIIDKLSQIQKKVDSIDDAKVGYLEELSNLCRQQVGIQKNIVELEALIKRIENEQGKYVEEAKYEVKREVKEEVAEDQSIKEIGEMISILDSLSTDRGIVMGGLDFIAASIEREAVSRIPRIAFFEAFGLTTSVVSFILTLRKEGATAEQISKALDVMQKGLSTGQDIMHIVGNMEGVLEDSAFTTALARLTSALLVVGVVKGVVDLATSGKILKENISRQSQLSQNTRLFDAGIDLSMLLIKLLDAMSENSDDATRMYDALFGELDTRQPLNEIRSVMREEYDKNPLVYLKKAQNNELSLFQLEIIMGLLTEKNDNLHCLMKAMFQEAIDKRRNNVQGALRTVTSVNDMEEHAHAISRTSEAIRMLAHADITQDVAAKQVLRSGALALLDATSLSLTVAAATGLAAPVALGANLGVNLAKIALTNFIQDQGAVLDRMNRRIAPSEVKEFIQAVSTMKFHEAVSDINALIGEDTSVDDLLKRYSELKEDLCSLGEEDDEEKGQTFLNRFNEEALFKLRHQLMIKPIDALLAGMEQTPVVVHLRSQLTLENSRLLPSIIRMSAIQEHLMNLAEKLDSKVAKDMKHVMLQGKLALDSAQDQAIEAIKQYKEGKEGVDKVTRLDESKGQALNRNRLFTEEKRGEEAPAETSQHTFKGPEK